MFRSERRQRPYKLLAAKAGFEYPTMRRTQLWILSAGAFRIHRFLRFSLLKPTDLGYPSDTGGSLRGQVDQEGTGQRAALQRWCVWRNNILQQLELVSSCMDQIVLSMRYPTALQNNSMK